MVVLQHQLFPLDSASKTTLLVMFPQMRVISHLTVRRIILFKKVLTHYAIDSMSKNTASCIKDT